MLQGAGLVRHHPLLFPQCPLGGAESLEEVPALGRAEKLGMLRYEVLDVERYFLQLPPEP